VTTELYGVVHGSGRLAGQFDISVDFSGSGRNFLSCFCQFIHIYSQFDCFDIFHYLPFPTTFTNDVTSLPIDVSDRAFMITFTILVKLEMLDRT